MTKKEHLFISAGSMMGGGLLCGYSRITTLGPSASTIFLVVGLIIAVSGFISLILASKRHL